jgi:CBS domain-containing protein
MQCQEIMSHEVQWIPPDEPVGRAAAQMAFHNLGFLPICNADGRPLGVITDRDIALRVIGKRRSPARTKLREVMTKQVHSVALDCPVALAGQQMGESGVARLLVLDEGGHLAGILSVADLLVRAPWHTALKTARAICAREMIDRSSGHPHRASSPIPEFFHGARDPDSAEEDSSFVENPARIEAQDVARGGMTDLKEFP